MRKIVCFSFLTVMLAVCSCSNKPEYIVTPVKETSFVDQDRPLLEPEKIDSSPLGLFNLMSYDKYLFFITRDNNAYLKIYDVETGSQVAAICHQGRASNEFNFPLFFTSEQAYTVNGEIMLPLMDASGSMTEINITKSIDQQRAVVNRTASAGIRNTNSHVAFVDDNFSRLFVSDLLLSSSEPARPVQFYVREADGGKTEIPVFKDVMSGEDNFGICNYYSGVLMKHPSKNIMVYSMTFLNYLFFMDLDNNKTYAIHQKNSETFDKYVTENPNTLHFSDATVSEDYYFTFYFYNCKTNQPDSDIECELLAFDWEGNYAGGFKSQTPLHRVTYNKKTDSLIFANLSDETLYSIPVKDILKK